MTLRENARYTWGGDESLFVEIDEAMSLGANLRAMTIVRGLLDDRPPGILDICPANASLLIRFDPDLLAPADLERQVRKLEDEAKSVSTRTLSTRLIEVPVWYDDPFTRETGLRFREGYHQAPEGTDLDFAAQVNGLTGPSEVIRRHHEQPWIVSMVGFVAGLPFLYQLVDPERQLQVPKYLNPRTDNPRLTVGHGGCFSAIHSVRGAGGYQMFGIAAAPIYDPAQSTPDFATSMVFFRPGDLVKFRSIDEQDYQVIQDQVATGSFAYRIVDVEFDVARALQPGDAYNDEMVAMLYG